MWSLPVSVLATIGAAAVIVVAGKRLVLIADHIADRTGIGEALIGATLLGAATSLADITAITTSAWNGFGSMAVSAAIGGIAVQTVFLVVADMRLRRVNLEHAAASLPNMISVAALILVLSLVLFAAHGPPLALWHIHPMSLVLFVAYGVGMRLVLSSRDHPMWQPRVTQDTRTDAGNEEQTRVRWGREITLFVVSALAVALSGWVLSRAGEGLMHHLGLNESAVGGIVIAVSTSLPELVTSVAAVRRRALTLAVGGIIGGNTFDTLMVGLADVAYTQGSIYHNIASQDLALTALTVFMSVILLLGLLLRQREGPANIGLESTLILVAYVAGVALLNMDY